MANHLIGRIAGFDPANVGFESHFASMIKHCKKNIACGRCGRLILKGDFRYRSFFISSKYLCPMCFFIEDHYRKRATNT